ncbi:MAG: DUF5662 family protein [Gammaproteobacteria bacterium]|nr:DUF5662 family protein [Gammaproteobacteria bacterium]
MSHPFKHFLTITRHRHKVMKYCFKCGLYAQGLLHDLSKYGHTEFSNGAKYYLGYKSPHYKEREDKGYSEAWMHHKGRNKHHIEYWTDLNLETHLYEPVKMPDRYLAECLCDRIAASENYNRGHFERKMVLEYFEREGRFLVMHPDTRKKLSELIHMYVEDPKKTFKYIKKNMRNKKATY